MTPRKRALMWRLVVPVAIGILPLSLGAQSVGRTPDDILKQESYQTPPRELVDAVTAPRYLNVSLTNASPDKKWFLDEVGDGPVVMKTFSKPFHELGGLFIDFKANRARPLTVRNNVGIQIISAASGTKKLIQLPAGARVSNAVWSPDGKSVAFYLHGEDATHIWIADVATGQSRQVTKTPVLATLMSSFDFTKDGKQIAAVLVPDTRTAMPQEPVSPPGPAVKLALDTDKNRLRTFPSLMSTPYQEQLLEWHTTGQLALIDVAKGTVKRVGSPAMIRAIDLAPDGKYVRVTRMVKPFSYDVPVANFGSIEEVWDDNGKALGRCPIRPRPLRPAAVDAAAATRPASAKSRGAPTARVSPTSNRSPVRPIRPAAAGAMGARAPVPRRPRRLTMRRRRPAVADSRRPSARTASTSGCPPSTGRART